MILVRVVDTEVKKNTYESALIFTRIYVDAEESTHKGVN